MRIRALDVTRFGALSDRRFKLDRKAVVVYGPNEAGKSSFHAAIETALYGFSPANRDSHPYARWDEDSSLGLSPGRSLSPTQTPSPLRRSAEEAPTGLGEEDSEVRTRQEYEQCVQTLASLVVGFGRSL